MSLRSGTVDATEGPAICRHRPFAEREGVDVAHNGNDIHAEATSYSRMAIVKAQYWDVSGLTRTEAKFYLVHSADAGHSSNR
jgi:hypothetical protein